MIEMDLRLDRNVQHQARAKHTGKDDPHQGVTLNSAIVVEIARRHRAKQSGDKRANRQWNTCNPRQHNAGENRVAHGIAHQRPAFKHQKHRQQRTGDGDNGGDDQRIDHKAKLKGFQQRR